MMDDLDRCVEPAPAPRPAVVIAFAFLVVVAMLAGMGCLAARTVNENPDAAGCYSDGNCFDLSNTHIYQALVVDRWKTFAIGLLVFIGLWGMVIALMSLEWSAGRPGKEVGNERKAYSVQR